MHSDVQTFCIELCKKGLEGLCTCVYGNCHTVIPERAPRCLREPYYPSQKYLLKPKRWLKSLEEGVTENLCDFTISSTDTIPAWLLKQIHSHSLSK